MQSQYIEYIVYIVLLIVSATTEYLKLTPPQTTVAVLALVTGHFFGNSVQLGNQVNTVSKQLGTLQSSITTHIEDTQTHGTTSNPTTP